MASLSTDQNFKWPSSQSLLPFQSSSLPNIPSYYDCSMIAPLKLAERKLRSQASTSYLAPIQLRSTAATVFTNEDEENELAKPSVIRHEERNRLRQKLDRSRISLTQTLSTQRHLMDKVQYKKNNVHQSIDGLEQTIDQLLNMAFQINQQISDLQDQTIHQRQIRDHLEMQKMKLRRRLTQCQKSSNIVYETVSEEQRRNLIEQYNAKILKLKSEYQKELSIRDDDIKRLKATLTDGFNDQSDEHMKLLRATERAYDRESQKRDLLRRYVDDYETHVYRASKPCCVSTSYRLNKISTQLRLHSVIELALHELIHSSCACGQFQRSYQTFLRLHEK